MDGFVVILLPADIFLYGKLLQLTLQSLLGPLVHSDLKLCLSSLNSFNYTPTSCSCICSCNVSVWQCRVATLLLDRFPVCSVWFFYHYFQLFDVGLVDSKNFSPCGTQSKMTGPPSDSLNPLL